jgi:outer membrane protein assembly factor BamB
MRNSVTGSYIARIDGEGRIKSIDPSFKNLLFNKIIIESSGAYYLIGEEERAGESYGFAAKRDENGNEVWRSRDRPYAHSFYQDGLLDRENRELVLAGTMRADEPDGTGGAPFIEGLNADTGELVWREVLTGPEFRGSALVSGVVKAPFYGFALTLSGIQDGYFAPPFMIARLNARGKL